MSKVYKHEGPLDFSRALIGLKQGKKIRRAGWNGQNMFLHLHKNPSHVMLPGLPEAVVHQPYILMYTVQGTTVPWLASQTDLLAVDWEIMDEAYFRDADRRNNPAPHFS